jgi:dTDP-glucose 4,6-dehydratase
MRLRDVQTRSNRSMKTSPTILVTGGAGFIGANFVLQWIADRGTPVVNLDKLTYAGNLANLASLRGDARHVFVQGDIGDAPLVAKLLAEHRPRAIVNFAAESHVDRSIHSAGDFIETNLLGTFRLLEAVRHHWQALPAIEKEAFRFLHVSTDEVYGSLGPADPAFSEDHNYQPNSPYSASKAGSDHLVRAWHHTYGLPVLTTNCSNNYGPFQFPEKLIPLVILNAMQGKPLPVYGDGQNVRDWLFVTDHCAAIRTVLAKGRTGEVYNIGGDCERTNIEVVRAICRTLDDLLPDSAHRPHERLISFVKDRPGHDRRYAIDSSKIQRELGWQPAVTFEQGLRQTLRWYLDNAAWVQGVQSGDYRNWLAANYSQRDHSQGQSAS